MVEIYQSSRYNAEVRQTAWKKDWRSKMIRLKGLLKAIISMQSFCRHHKFERALFVAVFLFVPTLFGISEKNDPKKNRIFIVSSYHRDYLWSLETLAVISGRIR